jgi:hypothetical protein
LPGAQGFAPAEIVRRANVGRESSTRFAIEGARLPNHAVNSCTPSTPDPLPSCQAKGGSGVFN